jgi:phenylalanine ammonia-lyase
MTMTSSTRLNTDSALASSRHKNGSPVIISGNKLTVHDVVRVARNHVQAYITDDPEVLGQVHASSDYIQNAATRQEPIYGVTSGFGGMAHQAISSEDADELQNNLIWLHKAGAGRHLPVRDVRAAMLLRANANVRGASGIRLEIIQRLITFLNAGVTPHVPEFGSIGASGDLLPLSYIAGSLIGLDESFTVDFKGETVGSITAVNRLGLEPLPLKAKEGLALINGTSMMTGIAANCVYEARLLLALALGAHALFIQAFKGTNQSFHPFIHQHKPHTGQVWSAAHMLELIEDSKLSRDELDGRHDYRGDNPIQDRYALRCLPQYMGPIVDGINRITREIEVEMNSASDNPLVDTFNCTTYHGGNFLGQYIGVGMDQLRYYLGLMAKHLDVQIGWLVGAEYNYGLSPSLIGNTERKVNMGLKSLQLCGNSIMPLLTYLGNSLVDRFPTHAEQFNQNINSQGFGSANLTRQSIETFQQYMAVVLMFTVQGVDLRTYTELGHYDAREGLSPATRPLYEAVREVVGRSISAERPYIWNDNEQFFDAHIARIAADIAANGKIPQAVRYTLSTLENMI